jgi:hypothetical protein
LQNAVELAFSRLWILFFQVLIPSSDSVRVQLLP